MSRTGHTPWSKNTARPSDRARPSGSPSPGSKRKDRNKGPQIPKSKQVILLESLHENLRSSTGKDKDPKGGCFCLARDHALSPYTPICKSCGLILCTLNTPYHACPHCSSLLLTQVSRDALAERLATQISDLLAKEAEERARIADETRKAVDAFPPLPGGPTPPSRTQSPGPRAQIQHTVVSLSSRTKKVITTSSRVPSRASSSPTEPEPIRVPPYPSEVVHAKTKPDKDHPWVNLRGPRARYVPPSDTNVGEDELDKGAEGKRRRSKRTGESS